MYFRIGLLIVLAFSTCAQAQKRRMSDTRPSELVNVFLGTSGDHGQMSPAASYPFSMLSIGPVTYPKTHTGYEYLAEQILGFTHSRFEGVGCQGSGGNILVKPFLGTTWDKQRLVKQREQATPGYYSVTFDNGISASFSVLERAGLHRYSFPKGKKGLHIDLASVLGNKFYTEEHVISNGMLKGFIEAGTTCNAGRYKVYYFIQFDRPVEIREEGDHTLSVKLDEAVTDIELRIAFSAISTAYAEAGVLDESFSSVKQKSSRAWDRILGNIAVEGDREQCRLFYSLLYRALQSPYLISEKDGQYKAIDGSLQSSKFQIYNGWAIWDNYKTQLPLLSFAYAEQYKGIAYSIANLYKYGKKDYATESEPSNTVRTEHAVVVVLDALRKGYELPISEILEPMKTEVDNLSYSSPDKAMESSYDMWALSQIYKELGRQALYEQYSKKALDYRKYWLRDFKDLSKRDVDAMSARKMYQGTVWQYRWLVPYDMKGLKELAGGEREFTSQLDQFFESDLYNHANEPDIHASYLFHATSEPWKAQHWIRRIAAEPMVQHYFNDNSRGIGSYIGRIYKNEPQAYLRTMDDDAGAMSSWYVLAACGVSPACVGEPVYYLHLPLFKSVSIRLPGDRVFSMKIKNYSPKHRFITSSYLNGKRLERNWITHAELMKGGVLEFISSETPERSWGVADQWISGMTHSE